MQFKLLLILLFASTVAQARTNENIIGVWELVDVTPVTLMDSNPRGVTNVKEYYAEDGTLFFIPPDKPLTEKAYSVKYSVKNGKRTLTSSDGRQFSAEISFPSQNELVVTQQKGDKWFYRRLVGERAYDQELEPVSREVLSLKEPFESNSRPVHYDNSDYSTLDIKKRLLGVWEVVEHREVSRNDAPPYGFLNDLWNFSEQGVSIVFRTSGSDIWPEPIRYEVEQDRLKTDAPEIGGPLLVSFDKWGRLILTNDRETQVLKLITKANVHSSLVPIKITLIKLRE